MSKILISYRREDSADVTGRIDDRLVQQFGREAVFMDVDSIPLGVDFRKYLDEQVAKCDVFLAVIGPDWAGSKHNEGKSKLEDPRNFVRIEIESALIRQIPVIPVLVRGAQIPDAKHLPTSLQDLCYRNGLEVRSGRDFKTDMDRLISVLKKLVQGFTEARSGQEKPSKPVPNEINDICSAQPVDMVKVPKGPFLYGANNVRMTIDYDYWIDKYPVTNEKYREFILADGYRKQAYWSEEGWKWKTAHNILAPEYWDNPQLNKEDCPVVGVSYYEAEAYAKWAGKRLPTELEWEKAARGEDGREYPWGDEFDKQKCNGGRLWNSKMTTSVTQYPNGVSPYGCYDMAENVHEWCADWYDQTRDSPVLRGGSWYGTAPPERLRVFFRDREKAGFRSIAIVGFRLIQDIP